MAETGASELKTGCVNEKLNEASFSCREEDIETAMSIGLKFLNDKADADNVEKTIKELVEKKGVDLVDFPHTCAFISKWLDELEVMNAKMNSLINEATEELMMAYQENKSSLIMLKFFWKSIQTLLVDLRQAKQSDLQLLKTQCVMTDAEALKRFGK